MSIRGDIEKKYKQSLKERNANLTNTIRLIKSAIKNKDIAARSLETKEEIKDQEILRFTSKSYQTTKRFN